MLVDASFLLELSKFDALFADRRKRPIDKVQSMVTHLRHHYFKELMAHGHHVLHTVPVYKAHHELSVYSLTDISFHVFSETRISRQTLTKQSRFQEPVIIIVGMTNNRSMPAMRLTEEWLAMLGRLSSFGAICISAER